MISAAFVGQAQSDICRKVKKPEGFAEKSASEPIEVATAVFISGDQEAQREADQR